jgi:hypothetical protein
LNDPMRNLSLVISFKVNVQGFKRSGFRSLEIQTLTNLGSDQKSSLNPKDLKLGNL